MSLDRGKDSSSETINENKTEKSSQAIRKRKWKDESRLRHTYVNN